MPKLLTIVLCVAAVIVVALTAVSTALLMEIRNDMDATTDAILLQDGVVADGIWVAVHSDQRPVAEGGKIWHSAPEGSLAAVAATTTRESPTTTKGGTPATTARPTTTRRPTTTTAAQSLVIEDFYLATDGETYFVEVSGVLGATYCEAHLLGSDGRRTGEWSNELLTGSQDKVTLSLWDYDRTSRPDAVEVECSS